MVDELMRDFGVGAIILGNLSAIYFYAYAGLQIPLGVMFDRFGVRRLMALAATICGIGATLFAFSENIGVSYFGRFLIGAGAGCSFIGSLLIASRWLPLERFAFLAGITQMLGMLGGIVGQAPIVVIVSYIGWRSTSFSLAILAFLLAIAAWNFVPEDTNENYLSGQKKHVLAGLKITILNSQVWLAAAVGLAFSASLLGFAALWGVPYLRIALAIDGEIAAILTSFIFLGWGVGAPFVGWLSDVVGRRKPLVIVGMSGTLLSLTLLLYWPSLPIEIAFVLCFTLGVSGSNQLLCFAVTKEKMPIWSGGAALGFVNSLVVGGGALFQPIIGFMLEKTWDGKFIAGVPFYSVKNYSIALSILIVSTSLGLLAALLITEKQ